MTGFDYIRDPGEIERQSFARIRALADLNGFDPEQRQIAMRLIHTCGEPGIVTDLRCSPNAVTAGLAALRRGSAVLCDVEMLRNGLSRRYLSAEQVHCFLHATGVAERAAARGETRSMAALDHWPAHLEGAIAVIGNAPTALFRLLELLLAGAPRPALIIALPVGFVGAAEAKEALIAHAPAPYITLRGRRGGSALAAAALNALARLAQGLHC